MGSHYSLPATVFFQTEGLRKYTNGAFVKHSKDWDPKDLDVDLTGKVFIVTGGNAGIGYVVCEELLKRRATVLVLCRNKEKGEKAIQSLKESTHNDTVELHLVDISIPQQIQNFCSEFLKSGRPLHCLINNAGVLLANRTSTPEGIESTFACNTLGTFLMTEYLMPALQKSSPSRVVVVSSGGMYTQKMDVKDFQNQEGSWDGTRAYAQTKRHQVYLVEKWAEKFGSTSVTFNSVHPGWCRTPGTVNSLPSWFDALDLRTPAQGADSILFLAISSKLESQTGKFWFDRKPVRTHMPLAHTQSTPEEVTQLYDYCSKFKVDLPLN